jgi:hypothetical protein
MRRGPESHCDSAPRRWVAIGVKDCVKDARVRFVYLRHLSRNGADASPKRRLDPRARLSTINDSQLL